MLLHFDAPIFAVMCDPTIVWMEPESPMIEAIFSQHSEAEAYVTKRQHLGKYSIQVIPPGDLPRVIKRKLINENGDLLELSIKVSTFTGFKTYAFYSLMYLEHFIEDDGNDAYNVCNSEYYRIDEASSAEMAWSMRLATNPFIAHKPRSLEQLIPIEYNEGAFITTKKWSICLISDFGGKVYKTIAGADTLREAKEYLLSEERNMAWYIIKPTDTPNEDYGDVIGHDYEVWGYDKQDGKFHLGYVGTQSKFERLTAVDLKLHVGDLCRFNLPIDEREVGETERTILSIKRERSYSEDGLLIGWGSVQYSKLPTDSTEFGEARSCDVAWIMNVVKRAPYKCVTASTFNYYVKENNRRASFKHSKPYTFDWVSLGKTKGKLRLSLIEIVTAILANRPHLHVREPLDHTKIVVAFDKSGTPGITIKPEHDSYRYYHNFRPQKGYVCVNRKTFTKWVLQNYQQWYSNKAEKRLASMRYAHDERVDYDRECQREWNNSNSYSDENDGATFSDQFLDDLTRSHA